MKFFAKLFARQEPGVPPSRPKVSGRLEIDEFGHGLVSIQAIDLIGPQAKSPDGRYRLIWADRSPDGRHGGDRESGHGTWALLRDDHIIVAGRLERPQDGKVVDDGTFILHDPAMTLAAVDRLVHHATIFEMNVESYRRRTAEARRAGPGRPANFTTPKVLEAVRDNQDDK